ncbi:hypothetical protein N7462_010463 [Penicillium macrosclerotiorum]|uniref:uncharacterized protein n=1 Tax=Penicillium macrosclerotiorum TaxID=303699 RepID=UPI0025480D54|nr:uncharacterized protein N7462_010463 [Penicillium macrosclerotiorum]KAJ5669393.1 hypothetical protein N7462_010463 [Penicillium macrosclerotiorum]
MNQRRGQLGSTPRSRSVRQITHTKNPPTPFMTRRRVMALEVFLLRLPHDGWLNMEGGDSDAALSEVGLMGGVVEERNSVHEHTGAYDISCS